MLKTIHFILSYYLDLIFIDGTIMSDMEILVYFPEAKAEEEKEKSLSVFIPKIVIMNKII